MTEMEKSNSSGCWKAAGIGCLALVLAGGLVGVWAYRNAGRLLRTGAAHMLDKGAEVMFEAMQLEAEDRQAAMAAIAELSEQVRTGELTMEQGGEILTALAEGPLPMIVALRLFETTILEPSALDAETKAQGRVTVSRFAEGLVRGSIPPEKGEEALDAISVQKEDRREMKPDLTTAELIGCLEIMKTAADEAGIEDRKFTYDLAEEIRKVIRRGLDV